MAGYIRQRDTQISNGSVADAADLKAEFDAVQGAFHSSTGHKHDGTSAEGPPIEVVGPAQDFTATATDFSPKTDDAYNLGSLTYQWKDAYFSGTIYGDFEGDVTGNADTATTLATPRTINNTSFDGSGNITTSRWGTARNISIGGTTKSVNGSGNVSWAEGEIAANTALTLKTPRTLTIGGTGKTFNGSGNVTWTLGEIGVNNNTLSLRTSGIASGSQNWTANQGSNSTFTVSVPGTNLGMGGSGNSRTITSSTGSNVSVPVVTTSNAGLMSTSDKSKLNGIASGAQVGTVTSVSGGTGLIGSITSSGSLSIDEASNSEADAGTASNKVMTPRRVSRAISTQLPGELASISFNAIGSYGLYYWLGEGAFPTDTFSGSELRPVGFVQGNATDISNDGNAAIDITTGGSSPPGTWRLHSRSNHRSGESLRRAGLFQRIA